MNQFDFSNIEARFRRLSDSCFINTLQEENQSIFLYADMWKLLSILGVDNNAYFRVSRRDCFSDRYERGEFPDSRYPFWHFSVYGVKTSTNTLKIWEEEEQQFKAATFTYASCWTSCPEENYLMWKGYTPDRYGVRIKSSVVDFINSLDLSSFVTYGSRMSYGTMTKSYDSYDLLFRKSIAYINEQEFRFYFKESSELQVNTAKRFLSVPVLRPDLMIKEVVLSPFMSRENARFLKSILEKYSDFFL